MKKGLFISLLLSFNTYAFSDTLPTTITITKNEIKSVYDGDTFRASLFGITQKGKRSTPIRIRHLDTPEIKGHCAKEKALAIEARDIAKRILFNSNSITLSNLAYDKYNRLLATVTIDNQYSFDKSMIKLGLARPYNGGKRSGWCN